MFGLRSEKMQIVSRENALPGRDQPIPTADTNFVTGRPLTDARPEGLQTAMFAMGCFWGVERLFWKIDGIWQTRVGYAGGFTPNPTYEEVCTGKTGHTEVVEIFFNPDAIGYEDLLKIFWENHDPTQGMRQGNDLGTQYRSAIFTFSDEQKALAQTSREAFSKELAAAGLGAITTEIAAAGKFFVAEDYHQQYLAKNPNGYCGIGGTGVTCPIGLDIAAN